MDCRTDRARVSDYLIVRGMMYKNYTVKYKSIFNRIKDARSILFHIIQKLIEINHFNDLNWFVSLRLAM
jgi:hypothetical protein